VKQKSQSSADFLGVLTVSENVLCGCCIPTTTGVIFVSVWRHPEPEKSRSNGRTGSSAESLIRRRAGQRHEKKPQLIAAAFRKIVVVVDRWVDLLSAG
jgi:hypothetical protein